MFIFAVWVKMLVAGAHPENFTTCEFSQVEKFRPANFRTTIVLSPNVTSLLCTMHYFVLYDILLLLLLLLLLLFYYIYIYILKKI